MTKRINISLADDLFERLERVKSDLNLSAICAKAIDSEVTYQELLRQNGRGKESIIKRLVAEKQEYDKKYFEMGRKEGSFHAKSLSYSDFVKISVAQKRINDQKANSSILLNEVNLGFDLNSIITERAKEHSMFDTEEYLCGWLEGVLDFWKGIIESVVGK